MRNKTFNTTLAGTPVCIEADADGSARYMVRMSIPGRMGRVRIGYLTGAGCQWLAEFFGNRPPLPAASAKAACFGLAAWAAQQPNIKAYFRGSD